MDGGGNDDDDESQVLVILMILMIYCIKFIFRTGKEFWIWIHQIQYQRSLLILKFLKYVETRYSK